MFGLPLGCGTHVYVGVESFVHGSDMLSLGGRASHNTFMTMLVDQGILGGVFYVAMLLWVLKSLRTLGRVLRGDASFLASVLPAVRRSAAIDGRRHVRPVSKARDQDLVHCGSDGHAADGFAA